MKIHAKVTGISTDEERPGITINLGDIKRPKAAKGCFRYGGPDIRFYAAPAIAKAFPIGRRVVVTVRAI